MMIKILLTIIFLSIFSLFLNAQNDIHSHNFVINYTSITKYSDEALDAIPELALDDTKYMYSLFMSNNKSKFCRDSLICIERSGKDYTSVWEKECIYKDYLSDMWLKISSAYKEGYGYERQISELTKNNKFKWTKTGFKKNILGFECVEVVDRAKTAFYAIKIPIPDGPKYGIFGLPGLVLEYEDESGHWKAVNINYSNKTSIKTPNVKTTSKESEIKMSVFDLKDLPDNKALRRDNTTPINKWIKFKN